MYRTRKPLEELALDLLFEALGESRYNRSPEDYERLCALIPPLKQAHFLVNQELRKHHDKGTFRDTAICDFKAGDRVVTYRAYPKTISIETIRNGLIALGFRDPKWQKRSR
jgi:hypothetical protein